MDIKNNHNSTQQTSTFSIRVEQSTLDRIEKIARERSWSRNKTINYLISQQVAEYDVQLGASK
jgi:predicted transcriptional regulator